MALAQSVFLIGCNGFSADVTPANVGGSGPQELARFAEKYGHSSTAGSSSYLIGPQDVLEISVFNAPELSKTVQVSEAGEVNLPLVGDVSASGKTASGLERAISTRLNARYMKTPQVTVFIKEYNSQRVTIEGAVRKPGVYPLRGGDTLIQAIARAEGLERETASSNVVVFRDNGRQVIRYDISQIRSGAVADPDVRMGDVIVVEDSTTKAAFQVLKSMFPLGNAAALIAIHSF